MSGNGNHATFSAGAPNPTWLSSAPPTVVLNGSIGQADTPVMAATRPVALTLQLMVRVNNLAGTYISGLIPEADMFFRAVTNDVRAYAIAADGSGNFLISGAGLALNSWHDFTLVGAPNLTTFYVDGVPVASIAKSLRNDASPKWRLGYSAGVTYGVGLAYFGTSLTTAQVVANGKWLRATYKYP